MKAPAKAHRQQIPREARVCPWSLSSEKLHGLCARALPSSPQKEQSALTMKALGVNARLKRRRDLQRPLGRAGRLPGCWGPWGTGRSGGAPAWSGSTAGPAGARFWRRGARGVGGRGESHRLHHVPVYPFLWLTKKEAYFTKFIRPTIFSPFAEKAVSNLWGGSRKSQVGHCNCCRLRVWTSSLILTLIQAVGGLRTKD